jgi:hypothetical protein
VVIERAGFSTLFCAWSDGICPLPPEAALSQFIALAAKLDTLVFVFLLRPSWPFAWIVALAVGLSVVLFKEQPRPYLNAVTRSIAKYSYGIYLGHTLASGPHSASCTAPLGMRKFWFMQFSSLRFLRFVSGSSRNRASTSASGLQTH